MSPPRLYVLLYKMFLYHQRTNQCLLISAIATGGYFDPLGLASGEDPDKVFRLKTAEIKHGRLAMVAFAGE